MNTQSDLGKPRSEEAALTLFSSPDQRAKGGLANFSTPNILVRGAGQTQLWSWVPWFSESGGHLEGLYQERKTLENHPRTSRSKEGIK